jgi:hypothetical protein
MRIFTLRNAPFFAENVRDIVDPHQPWVNGSALGVSSSLDEA